MNREDLNWRKLNLQTAMKTINQMPDCQSAKAFVLDDSIKILRSMALVPNHASANKKSTLTPPRMAVPSYFWPFVV
jgi:hypothetical protein